MKIKQYASFVLTYIGSVFATLASDFTDLRFITVDEPPANYLSQNGVVSGYTVDIVNHLQAQLGFVTDIEVMPESRAMHTLEQDYGVVMFSISRTAEREHKYHWLAHVISKRWAFYSRHDSKLTITSLEDLLDSNTVGVIRGDIRQSWLKEKNARYLVELSEYDRAIEMLLGERIDLLFYESFGIFSTLQKLGYNSNSVKLQFIANESDVYIVMSKFAGSEKLANKLEKHFAEIKTSDWHKKHTATWQAKLNILGIADAWVVDGVLHY